MKPKSRPVRIRIMAVTLAMVIPALVHGQTVPNVSPEIVSAWKGDGEDALLIFRYDGTYQMAQESAVEPGMERGTFIWNRTTSSFSATALVDTNGEAGLSHPLGATTMAISGNTMTYTVAGEGSFTFSRVVNAASAIVGSWLVPGTSAALAFLADGTYFHIEETNDSPYGYDGMERGVYAWNATTHVLTTNAATDTNGDIGIANLPTGFTAAVSGNTLTLSDGHETTVLKRITTNPAPLALPDFVVRKQSNYTQKSAAGPALVSPANPGEGIYPYRGEASIRAGAGAVLPTLKIGAETAQPLIEHANGRWSREGDYASKTLLDAVTAFPDNKTYEFKSDGATASLTFPGSGAFLMAPAVISGNGSWEEGSYNIGTNGTLVWSGHDGFDPATRLTVLSLEDLTDEFVAIDGLVIQGDVTSYDLGGKLAGGHHYGVTLEHVKIAGSTNSGSGVFSGKQGYALYSSSTRLSLTATAEDGAPPEITDQPRGRIAILGEDVIMSVGVTGSPAPTFRWSRNGRTILGQTGNSLALFNIDVADYGDYVVTATNSAGVDTSEEATISAPMVPTPYDEWADDFFDASQTSDPLLSGPEIDFDNDGIPNLMEFLLGGNPKVPGRAILPTLATVSVSGGRNLVFTYRRKLVAAGVGEVVEHAADLNLPWTAAVHGQSGVTIALHPIDAQTEEVVVTIPTPGNRHFVRLGVPGGAVHFNPETSYRNFKGIGLQPQRIPAEVGMNTGTAARAYGDFFGDGSSGLFTASLKYSPQEPITAAAQSEFAFWRRQQDGTFVKDTHLLSGGSGCLHPRKALVADFNGDGRPDVFVVCHGYDASPFPGERNRIILSQPGGTYAIADAATDVAFFHGAAAADVDRDGDIDVVAVRGSGRQMVFLNQGNGFFIKEANGRLPESISFANYFTAELLDVNDDRWPDLVAGGHEWEAPTRVFLNPGNFKFSAVQSIIVPAIPGEGVVLDFTVTGTGQGRTLWVLRTSGGDGSSYESRTIQKVIWSTRQSSVPLQQRPAKWIPWLIPMQSSGQDGVGGDDFASGVFVPQ